MNNLDYTDMPPSVRNPLQSEKMSKKYGFSDTYNMVNTFVENGFNLISAQASKPTKKDPRSTKHLLRFRPVGQAPMHGVHADVIVKNSHDGTSSLKFMVGIFRLACLNGIIICDSLFAKPITHRHTLSNIILAETSLRTMMETSLRVTEYIPKLINIDMSQSMLDAYALQASTFLVKPVESQHLLQIRREEDRHPNLWAVYNRVQENLIKGGLRTQHVGRRIGRTRAVRSIEKNVSMNNKLWELTVNMAENHPVHM
tara:strand:+ start:1423 stop:2190 length:768 start_codon:yes stop_codon:yes gene_type:complete